MFSILILAVIMSITFAILGIFIPKIKIAADPIKSIAALSAADSGLEWCLYINRGNPLPEPLPKPVFGNGEVVEVYFPSAGIAQATCNVAETPSDHRSVGSYLDISRSLQIQ